LRTSLSQPQQGGMAQAISALRAKASHAADDNGIMDSAGGMHITNADQYSIAFARTPAQVPPNPGTGTSNPRCNRFACWFIFQNPNLIGISCQHKLPSLDQLQRTT